MKVLVTGANGFIGRALCHYLAFHGHQVIPVVRQACDVPNAVVLTADDDAGWLLALQDCDAVVHLAGKSRVNDRAQDPLCDLRQANLIPSIVLYERASRAGVGRFVFISTAKIHGEQTAPGHSFSPDDIPAPADAYAHSKWQVEQALWTLARQKSDLDLVIIRPPLVYGPGVKGNFASMVRWVQKGIPLPFSCLTNERSMIAVENLSSFITLCADRDRSTKAANETFLVSDGAQVSTTALLRLIAETYGIKARLFCIPPSLMLYCFRLFGKSLIANRLLESLVLNDKKSREMLDWNPPITMSEQLQRMRVAEIS
jgi:nucleoside-diphosphate-sugar epimerase